MTPAEYQGLLSRARIAVVLHGVGPQSYRLFEAMAHGCALVAQEIYDTWFQQIPGVQGFDAVEGMLAGIQVTRETAYGGEDLGRFNRASLLNNHTHLARAAGFLDEASCFL